MKNSFFFNLMLPWQPNKMVTGHGSMFMEKMQFNHFLIISLWEFSVAMATKLRDRLADF